MAINQIYIPQTQAFLPPESLNFAPLMDIAKQIKEQRDTEDAVKQLQELYAQGGQPQQMPPQIPPQIQRPPAPPPAAPAPPAPPTRSLMPPPLATPQQRISEGFSMFPNAPQGAPAGATRAIAQAPGGGNALTPASGPSPFDNAEWPQGPVGGPSGNVFAANEPSPLDVAAYPFGPIGAPGGDAPTAVARSVAAAPAVPPPDRPVVTAAAAAPSPDGLDRALKVIKQKESSGDYYNVTTTRDRQGRLQHAVGAYGVMDFNIPQWTKEVFGRSMTVEEFRRDPSAQDAVARAKLGEYASKYGSLSAAARAWFAGPGNMNNMGARDPLGTSVAAYSNDFNAKMGGGDLPPEITGGSSRSAPASSEATLAFDASGQPTTAGRVVQNLSSGAPTRVADISSEQLAALYRNPQTRNLAAAFLQKRLAPDAYDVKVEGGYIVRSNKNTGQVDYQKLPEGLVTVPEKSSIYDPQSKTWVKNPNAGIDKEKYGALPSGKRWIDPNDPSKGVEGIPGAAELPAEVSARIGLAKSFLSTLPDLRKRVDRGDIGLNPDASDKNLKNHGMAIANVGVPGETKRMLDAGAESLIRMLTGAGMNKEEATQTAEQYRLTAKDTTFSIKSKIDALERHLYHIGDVLSMGRGANILRGEPGGANDRRAIEDELRRRGAIK